MKIPVYEPILNQGNESKYLQKCIKKNWVSSDGYFVKKFEEEFAKWSGNKFGVAVCNGTAALETAIWASKAHEYKYINIPDNTIISCALVAIRLGLTPFFYDTSLNCQSEVFNTEFPTISCHLFGNYHLNAGSIMIEDSSQYWKPFKVRDVACYSLFANKLITSGEGGVLVTNKKEIYDRARSYRNLCHSKERFVHNEIGYNFRMSNLQAAVALAQLEQIDKFTEIKQKNRDLYKKYLPDNVKILFDVPVPWMYLIETKYDAGKMVKKLAEQGIDCRRFFYPLHKQPCFNGKYEHLNLPNSDYAWNHWFYLPSGLTLTDKEIKWVCKSLKDTLAGMI